MVDPSLPSLIVFLVLVAYVIAAWVLGVRRTAPDSRVRTHTVRASIAAVLWLGLTAGIAEGGLMERELPVPGFVPPLVLFSVVAVAAAFGPVGRRLGTLPLGVLVGFHAFRLPLEAVLHTWGLQGVAPEQLTWSGENFDVLTGVLALAIAPFAARSRAAVWAFNVIGFALLMNILRIVARSFPGPSMAYSEPVLLPFHAPTVWIGSVCVVGALIGHLVLFRALAAGDSETQA